MLNRFLAPLLMASFISGPLSVKKGHLFGARAVMGAGMGPAAASCKGQVLGTSVAKGFLQLWLSRTSPGAQG